MIVNIMAGVTAVVTIAYAAGWLTCRATVNRTINRTANPTTNTDTNTDTGPNTNASTSSTAAIDADTSVRLRRAVFHDPLTGLYNRAGWQEHAQAIVTAALRAGRPVAVGLVDVDWLKKINDSLGHAAGDTALTIIAQRLDRLVRPHGLAARLGGDEFGVVLVGPQSAALDATVDATLDPAAPGWVDDAARRLHRGLCQPATLAGGRRDLSASLGIAPATDPGGDIAGWLTQADRAMYRTKHTNTTGIHTHQGTASHSSPTSAAA